MGLTRSSRRQFLQSAAGAICVPWFVPGMALGADGNVAASERIALGFIGMGNQGSGNMRGMMSLGTTQVVAVCDPFQNRRNSAKQTAEAYYAKRSGGGTYKGCRAYNDFRELVARDDIDAVGIASPGHWHGIQSVAALKSGKDVYCEKPLTVTINEG